MHVCFLVICIISTGNKLPRNKFIYRYKLPRERNKRENDKVTSESPESWSKSSFPTKISLKNTCKIRNMHINERNKDEPFELLREKSR